MKTIGKLFDWLRKSSLIDLAERSGNHILSSASQLQRLDDRRGSLENYIHKFYSLTMNETSKEASWNSLSTPIQTNIPHTNETTFWKKNNYQYLTFFYIFGSLTSWHHCRYQNNNTNTIPTHTSFLLDPNLQL